MLECRGLVAGHVVSHAVPLADYEIRFDPRQRRAELAAAVRFSWSHCAFHGCCEASAWIVALRMGQRALCAFHASEAFAQGRGLVPVESFLKAEP